MSGTPVGLDFTAIMTVGAAQGVDLELLADVLPAVETTILVAASEQSDED